MFSLLSERLCVDAAQPSAEPGSRCCDLKSRTLACVQRLRFYARAQSAPVACISGIVARHDLLSHWADSCTRSVPRSARLRPPHECREESVVRGPAIAQCLEDASLARRDASRSPRLAARQA